MKAFLDFLLECLSVLGMAAFGLLALLIIAFAASALTGFVGVVLFPRRRKPLPTAEELKP